MEDDRAVCNDVIFRKGIYLCTLSNGNGDRATSMVKLLRSKGIPADWFLRSTGVVSCMAIVKIIGDKEKALRIINNRSKTCTEGLSFVPCKERGIRQSIFMG